MVGFAVFSDEIKVMEMVYGSSYVLAVVAWLMAWGVTSLYSYYAFIVPRDSSEERAHLIHRNSSDKAGTRTMADSAQTP